MQMGVLQSATLTSIENVAVEIFFFPPLEEMASSHKQNACRLHILPVKCLKTPPAGIGQWNVLRNRTFYRNVGSLKRKSHLPLTAGGCAPKTAKWCLPDTWGSANIIIPSSHGLCSEGARMVVSQLQTPARALWRSQEKNN